MKQQTLLSLVSSLDHNNSANNLIRSKEMKEVSKGHMIYHETFPQTISLYTLHYILNIISYQNSSPRISFPQILYLPAPLTLFKGNKSSKICRALEFIHPASCTRLSAQSQGTRPGHATPQSWSTSWSRPWRLSKGRPKFHTVTGGGRVAVGWVFKGLYRNKKRHKMLRLGWFFSVRKISESTIIIIVISKCAQNLWCFSQAF